MLWAAALAACTISQLALAAPADVPASVTASPAAAALPPQPPLSANGTAVPAHGQAGPRQAAQTVNASGEPYNLSAAAQGPAPGSDPAPYARRRTVPVSNGTHILYNVSVVAADGSPAPLSATPFNPDQTLYTTPPSPTAPASNTPLITWVTIAGGVVGAALVASSVLLLTDFWAGRLPCLCCCRPRQPPPPESRDRARDGARELRLPVLVVNPGKDVVVAQRVSMDRAATAGAPLPVLDDYVFHKTSSTADQAGMSAMVEAQLEHWRSQATTASGCLPEALSPSPSRPLPASPPLSRAGTLTPHPSSLLPRGAGAGTPLTASLGLGRGGPHGDSAHAGANSAARASEAAEAAAGAEVLQVVVHPAGGRSRGGMCSAAEGAADAPAGSSRAAPAGAWGRSRGQRAPPQGTACLGSASFGAGVGATDAISAASHMDDAGRDRLGRLFVPSEAEVIAGAGTEGSGDMSGAGGAPGPGASGAARPWPARVAVSPFALDALQLQRHASE